MRLNEGSRRVGEEIGRGRPHLPFDDVRYLWGFARKRTKHGWMSHGTLKQIHTHTIRESREGHKFISYPLDQ